ncbi:tyrosine-type recombinase/integrase [Maliponia aquimaris]|uniref:Phage integrase family protein n=1 Tax=Maliponia aquimaris TaxID=1673631 RepID=A0A238KIF4_9RHOB|nr:tyrosine-type recombinase/integrase [Maliponia aquimaris]SMX42563.1 Phage integrase family protein [Maliponia aquimaris]
MTKRRNPFPGVGNTPHVDRHGKKRWRLRRTVNGRKVDTYLPGPYGSAQFRAAYEAAISGTAEREIQAAPGTFDHVIEHMLRSAKWRDLRETTRGPKRGRLDWIRERIGRFRLSDLQPRHVAALMDKKGGPHAANRLHKELVEIYAHAAAHFALKGTPPTAAVDRRRIRSDGFHTWTVEQVEQFRAHHASGTMPRLAFELALGTGAARQDVARMGAANLRGGAIVYSRGKTGGHVELPLALLPELARELALHPAKRPVFITRQDGAPFSVAGFGNAFRDWIAAAGLPSECSLHGLRKHGATRLAERRATEFQIMAFLGHESPNEARRYVAKANRATMVADALRLLPTNESLPNLSVRLGKDTSQPLKNKGEI